MSSIIDTGLAFALDLDSDHDPPMLTISLPLNDGD
jgi:hypothetical protein